MITLTDKQVTFIKDAIEEAASVLEWPEQLSGEEVDQALGLLDEALAVLSGDAVVV